MNINKIKIKSWTSLFTSIMKFLYLSGRVFPPNVKTLRIFTGLHIDNLLYFKPKYIKYHKVKINNSTNSTNSINSINSTSSNISEWIWNTNKILNYKSHTKYIFYIHGGAFCAGDSYNVRGFLYRLSERTNSVIFSINYRKAPEYKYPIPLLDCIDAYMYFLTQIKNLDENPIIIIMGDSAGGNLAVNLIAYLIKSNLHISSACILISPWVNLTDWNYSQSWKVNKDYDFVKSEMVKFFAFQYIDSLINKLEDVSLLYLSDDILTKFPPILIEYGDYEVLRDQIQEFSIKLEKLGIDITYNSRYEMIHNFPLFYFTKIPQAEDFFISVTNFINKISNKN